jgi:hypothetical protein
MKKEQLQLKNIQKLYSKFTKEQLQKAAEFGKKLAKATTDALNRVTKDKKK